MQNLPDEDSADPTSDALSASLEERHRFEARYGCVGQPNLSEPASLDAALRLFSAHELCDPSATARKIAELDAHCGDRRPPWLRQRRDLLAQVIQHLPEYFNLRLGRRTQGKRGRPIKSWLPYLHERRVVDSFVARRESLRQPHPELDHDARHEKAIEQVAKENNISPHTLEEWYSHRGRLHRRSRI